MSHFDESGLDAAAASLTERGIDVVRLGYADLIGTERGRDVLVNRFARTVGDGVAFCRSVYGTSPMGDVVDIEGGLADGLPDVVAFPDLDHPAGRAVGAGRRARHRRRLQPGRHAVGGEPAHGAETGRRAVRRARHAPDGRPGAGVLRAGARRGARDRLEALRRGHRQRLRLRHAGRPGERAAALAAAPRPATGIEVVAANHEFASGQFEINLWHSEALDAADRAFRFKAAVKELARREDKLATFMAKPFNDEGGSGFHIHFSTWDDDGDRRCSTTRARRTGCPRRRTPPSPASWRTPRRWPRSPTRPSTPTSGSGPDTLAPWLIDWGLDNRSAMVRVPPERGRAARLELRLGDATANPYLAIAALLAAALPRHPGRARRRRPRWRATATTRTRPSCCRRISVRVAGRAGGRHRPRRPARPEVRRRPSSPTSATSSSGSPDG